MGAPRAMTEAYFLAGIGGFVDSFGILTLSDLFVAHMSGNSAAFGAAFGQGQWAVGWPHLFAIPIFVVGLFLGYVWMLGLPNYRRCAIVLLVEAFLLTLFGIGMICFGPGPKNSLQYFLLAGFPLLAMGLQNATLREIGRSAFATTYVTGVLDSLAKALAKSVIKPESLADRLMVRRAALMWLSYVVGAVVGSAGFFSVRYLALAIPVLTLLVLAGRFFTQPGSIAQSPSAPAP